MISFWWWNAIRSLRSLPTARALHGKALLSDVYFGGSGVTLLFASGIANLEIVSMPFHANPWAIGGAVALLVATMLWLASVLLHARQAKPLAQASSWKEFQVATSTGTAIWYGIRTLVLALLVAAIFIMVLKPTWG